jgi:hypothetical protein|tara:strand:+ start:1704 stop:1961 length:258 start_codon:yes stop_codon:yes gene_type:complete
MDKELKKTPGQAAELQKMLVDIIESAHDVVLDYTEDPSDMSGSFHFVHGSSPVLQHQETKDRLTTTPPVAKKKDTRIDSANIRKS